MRYSIVLLSLAWFLSVQAEGAFDSSCFREVSEIEVASGVTSIGVMDVLDDVFVVSSQGKILPSRQESTEKNPPLRYTSLDDVQIGFLDDGDPFTGVEIDPLLLVSGGVSYTFDLARIYPRGQILPRIGYVTDRQVTVSISLDGDNFVPVSQSNLEDFDMRYLRVTFSGAGLQNGITRFHTLNFFQKVASRYLLSSPPGKVKIFRSYACQQGRYMTFLTERPTLQYSEEFPQNTITLQFQKNPTYRDDTDGDGHDNLRDNCPIISNADQSDRNRDGVGDICSDDDEDNQYGNNDNCPTIPNPDQRDMNTNGIGDACEFDTDGDGITDSIDNAIHIKNPDQKDADNDRIGDIMDNCMLYNPDQLDLDKNARGDTCDRDEAYRKINDSDKDGVLDFSDNCPKSANTDQSDIDGDGRGNICDNCQELKNSDQADTNRNMVGDACEDVDGDSIIGWRDNCPSIKNSEQTDSDNNGIGNACSDTDGDSIYDSVDTCPTVSNKDQNDIDKDGAGDICDTEDNRFLESNKYIFMILIGVFGLVFIMAIILLIRKLQ